MLSVGSRLTKLEAHTAIMSTFDKFALKTETREGFLNLLKLLHPEDSLPKHTKHLLSYNEGKHYKIDCCSCCEVILLYIFFFLIFSQSELFATKRLPKVS
jgi:hypothetical protein